MLHEHPPVVPKEPVVRSEGLGGLRVALLLAGVTFLSVGGSLQLASRRAAAPEPARAVRWRVRDPAGVIPAARAMDLDLQLRQFFEKTRVELMVETVPPGETGDLGGRADRVLAARRAEAPDAEQLLVLVVDPEVPEMVLRHTPGFEEMISAAELERVRFHTMLAYMKRGSFDRGLGMGTQQIRSFLLRSLKEPDGRVIDLRIRRQREEARHASRVLSLAVLGVLLGLLLGSRSLRAALVAPFLDPVERHHPAHGAFLGGAGTAPFGGAGRGGKLPDRGWTAGF